jgi:hypothetical protein
MSSSSSATRVLANLGLLAFSVLFSLMALELAYRAWRSADYLAHWPNFAAENRATSASAVSGFQYDATLGFVALPRKAYANEWGSQPVLATGDSFTYGDDVSGSETWPAYLQSILHIPTINAGVSGYGLDQTVLLTERLSSLYRPRIAIVSFIGDDVRRVELRRIWNGEKPFFELAEGELELRNVPVPKGDDANRLSASQKLLGWSAIVARLWPWLEDVPGEPYGRRERATPRGTGEEIVCRLMQRLAANDVRVIVVAQYDPRDWRGSPQAADNARLTQLVLGCARKAGLQTLDTFPVVDATVRAQGIDAIFDRGHDHHNAAGNLLIAKTIAAELEKQGIHADSR